jgi:hypothetical protein
LILIARLCTTELGPLKYLGRPHRSFGRRRPQTPGEWHFAPAREAHIFATQLEANVAEKKHDGAAAHPRTLLETTGVAGRPVAAFPECGEDGPVAAPKAVLSGCAALIAASLLLVASRPAWAQDNAPPPAQGAPPPYPPPGYAPYPPPQPYPPPGYAPYPPGYPPPQPAVYVAPPNTHDGFYLRLHLGGGFTSFSGSDSAGNSGTISGASASFGIALGGVIARDFVIFGNLFGSTIERPTVSAGGTSVPANGTVSLSGIGAGLAYYVTPLNLYISGTVAATQGSVNQNGSASGNNAHTNFGRGLQGIVGKEWWVSPNWGIGVAGEFVIASMKDNDFNDFRWTAAAYNILFSATYN